MDKQKLFTIARTALGVTMEEFAEDLGYSVNFIYLVLRGERKSVHVEKEVENFINRGLRKLNTNQLELF